MQLSSKSLDTVIRFSFNLLIVRKIGISREVAMCFYIHLPFFYFSSTNKYLVVDTFTFACSRGLCGY